LHPSQKAVEKVREALAKLHGSRRRFQGTVDRFGQKAGWKYTLTTVMLKDVSDCASQKVVTDHLWFTLLKRFESLNLIIGDVISFDARVTKYLKGYQGRRDDDYVKPMEVDYRLSFPTKLVKVESATPLQLTIPLEQKSIVASCCQADLQRWL
jgi:hypothetical protein